jgi:2-dehydrotetronate isomerase
MQTFIMNLGKAADLCAPLGVTLLIETNNLYDNPNYLLRTLAEAREVIDRVERSNLRVIFDFYHVQINEGDVTRRFLESLDLIDHIQFANPPGRNEPGVGEPDFDHIFHLIVSSATRSG